MIPRGPISNCEDKLNNRNEIGSTGSTNHTRSIQKCDPSKEKLVTHQFPGKEQAEKQARRGLKEEWIALKTNAGMLKTVKGQARKQLK